MLKEPGENTVQYMYMVFTCTCIRISFPHSCRTGCKPFVEVHQDGERVYASATHESMESIRSFHSEDGCVEIPLSARIRGNLLVVVHHIRAIPVAKKAGIVRLFHI